MKIFNNVRQSLSCLWSSRNLPVMAGVAVTLFTLPAGAQQFTVQASIDRQCTTHEAKIVVPAGQVARGFTIGSLDAGRACTTGGLVGDKAWGIGKKPADERSGDVYYYNHNANGSIYSEIGGQQRELQELALNPGTYFVHVDGGIGATVSVSYNLESMAPPPPAGAGAVIFFNGNDGGVSPGGTSPSFSVNRPVRITYMFTYHYGYQGAPGKIRIINTAGGIVGEWNAQGRSSSPKPSWYWEVTPNIDLGPGTYRIETSDPQSWSQNAGSNGEGMVQVKGQ